MGLFQKIKELFAPKEEGQILSVKGYYMIKYCQKIANKTWQEKDYNESYENGLEDFRKTLYYKDGSSVSREDAAEMFIEIMKEVVTDFCDELVEMGVNSFE